MLVGIVGYAGCGKSTLFELLTGAKPDPSAAHAGQRAMAVLPDERLDRLQKIYHAKKITRAAIELIDTPGLPRDSQSAARQLAVLRNTTGLVLVIGAFAGVDPSTERARFEEDLLLADLELVSGRLERLRDSVRKPRPDRDQQLAEIALLEPIEQALGEGKPLRELELRPEQQRAIRSFALLTQKPRVVVVNAAEDALDAAAEAAVRLGEAGEHVEVSPLRFELELAQLNDDEREAFLEDLHLERLSRERLLHAILDACGQITFFTAGEKEVRAWLLDRGWTAAEAAGGIHSDMQRGFIRAEVMRAADLFQLGSERDVKAAGKHRLEGKDYVVQEEDVLLIRFSV